MKQTLIHSTENSNYYLYDDQSRLSILIHPELKKASENPPNADLYYLKKYEYLKKHFFKEERRKPQFEEIHENDIVDSIIQTTQIVFEVTESCNLNCVYCGYGDLYQVSDERNHNSLDVNYAVKLLNYIFDLKIRGNKNKLMIGFYGGEPLLNIKLIKEIVREANFLNREKKLDLEYSITTNATLLRKNIDFLSSNNIQLAISLDGNRIGHDYRIFKESKKSSFDKVIENVDYIKEYYPDYFDRCINFISVLNNKNSIRSIYEFIYGRYQKIPEIIELNTNGFKPEKKETLYSMFHSKRESENEYKRGSYPKIPTTQYESLFFRDLSAFVKHYSINYYLLNKSALFRIDEKYFPTGTCLPFSLKIFLTTRNNLLPCEKINYKYALGKVDKNVEINAREIADRYNNYFSHATKICENCYNYKFCGACIFHFKNLDKIGTKELVCNHFKDEHDFERDLYLKFSYLEANSKDFFFILENVESIYK